MKAHKTHILLASAILFYALDCILDPAEYFPKSDGRGFTFGAMLFIFLMWPIVFHSLIIGFIGFLVAKLQCDKNKGFRVFAILLFSAGLFRVFQSVLLL